MNWLLVGYSIFFGISVVTVGSYIFKKIGLSFESSVESFMYKFALGCMAYSYLFLVLGAFHILSIHTLLAGYLVPVFFFVRSLWTYVGRFSLPRIDWHLGDSFSLVLIVFILFPLVPHLFRFPASWDALAYHLPLPKLYLQDHSFRFYADFPQTGYPIGIESLFGFGEIFAEPRFGNILNFSFLAAILIYMLWGLGKKYSYHSVVLASLVFCFHPVLYTEVSVTPLVDYAFAFFGLLAARSLAGFISAPQTRNLGLTLALLIFCSTIKFTGYLMLLALAATLLLLYVTNSAHRLFWGRVLKKKAYFFTIFMVMLLPCFYWLGKNYLTTHNPVYPMMGNFFKAIDYDPATFSSIFDQIKVQNILFSQTRTHLSLRVDRADDYAYLTQLAYFGLLVILTIIAVFKSEKQEKYLSLFLLITILTITFIVGPLYRYYLPVVPAIALIISSLITSSRSRRTPLMLIVGSMFLFIIFLQVETAFFQRGRVFADVPKLALLRDFDYNYQKKLLFSQDNYTMIDYINRTLDPGADKVLFIFDNRLYYFNVPAVFENPTILGHFTNPGLTDIDEIQSRMRSEGITHVLISTNWGTYPNLLTDVFDNFVRHKLEKIYSEEQNTSVKGLTLYKLI